MKNARIRRLLAGAILAVGMVSGLAGCDGETVSEVAQEATSQVQESFAEESAQESQSESTTEEHSAGESTQEKVLPEFDYKQAEAAVTEWVDKRMKADATEGLELPGDEGEVIASECSYTVLELSEGVAKIRYYIFTSTPGIHVVDETVTILWDEVGYYVETQNMQLGDSIISIEEMANCYGGFCEFSIESVCDCYTPFVNTGAAALEAGPVWEGKAVAELNEQEQNAYGSAIRAELLAEPGKVLKLSNRTMTETYTYIDLDGDGVTEKICLSGKDVSNYHYWPYDHFVLQIGKAVLEDYASRLHNDLYAFSMDGKEILILMLEDGPSSDDESYLYAYREGQIVKVGQMSSHIGTRSIKNGRIHGSERGDVIQSDYISVYWHIGESGLLEQIPQESYDYGCLNDIELLVALPVHSEPNLESTGFEIQPQTVKFLKTDSTFSWVYVQAENGDAGWVYVGYYGDIVELNMDSTDVFEGLLFFG